MPTVEPPNATVPKDDLGALRKERYYLDRRIEEIEKEKNLLIEERRLVKSKIISTKGR